MTERDEIVRLLIEARRHSDTGAAYDLIQEALAKARTLDTIEELRLRMAENLAEVRKVFGSSATLGFEITCIADRVDITYSVGRDQRDSFAMTVDGRGATLAQAIANARQLTLRRG